MKIYEQVDRTGDILRYTWILSGWKWLKGYGCKGCYVTSTKEEAEKIMRIYNLVMGSNSTQVKGSIYEAK